MIAFNCLDPTREVLKRCCYTQTAPARHLMKVVAISTFESGTLIPGIRIKTTSTDFFQARQVQMMRFTCERWQWVGLHIGWAGRQLLPLLRLGGFGTARREFRPLVAFDSLN